MAAVLFIGFLEVVERGLRFVRAQPVHGFVVGLASFLVGGCLG
jgi:hypothetical protein